MREVPVGIETAQDRDTRAILEKNVDLNDEGRVGEGELCVVSISVKGRKTTQEREESYSRCVGKNDKSQEKT